MYHVRHVPLASTVWLLNPYDTGSHKAWAEGYAAHSAHRVRVLAMQGYFWKWRMHGGALELAEQARAAARAAASGPMCSSPPA